MANDPPLPQGFQLDEQSDPQLPAGFKVDQTPQRSLPQELGRQTGLAARYGIEGAAALPAMIANIPASILDKALEVAEHASGKKIDFRFGDQGAALSNALTQAGLPNPENATERVVGDASRAVAGAGSGIGVGKVLANEAAPIVQSVGESLKAQPAMQAASAVTGAGSAGVARENGIGPTGQLVAGMAGSVIPGVVASGSQELVRRGFRGGEQGRQTVENNLNTFNASGADPTVGQATQNRRTQAAESLLSKTPGSAGVMTSAAEQQAENISAGLAKTADTLAPKTTGEQAGRAITQGINGEDTGFIAKFKAKQGQLYDALDAHIAPDTPISVSNTRAALNTLNQDIKGAPAISAFFKNSKIQGIQGALESDVSQPGGALENSNIGNLPYESIKKLRTLVGNELSDSWAGSDVPRSKWKALYGALSSDLEAAAKKAGPDATQAWQRANNYTRAGMGRIDAISHVMDKNGGPEKVFQAALSGTKEGATTLRAVMQSLPEDAQKTVSATVIRRLGMAKAGVQNEIGDQFSTESFLTNWNSLSTEAKRTLFDRYGSDFRSNMDQVAAVAANLRSGSKVFRNPSGTGQAVGLASAAGAFFGSLFSGHPATAGVVAGGVGSANLSARLMTNPNFVKWLAISTKAPVSAAPALINNLAQQGKKKNDPDLTAAADLLATSAMQ